MTMRKYGDLVATVGTWKDERGEVHKCRLPCGVVMRDDASGRMSICLDLVPVSSEWGGWLSVIPRGSGDA